MTRNGKGPWEGESDEVQVTRRCTTHDRAHDLGGERFAELRSTRGRTETLCTVLDKSHETLQT